MDRIVYNECLSRIQKVKRNFTRVEELVNNPEESADFMGGLEIMLLEGRAA